MNVQVKPAEKLRILIVAEHASALFGGEAMLPLQYFKHLRMRDVDVTIVVHERCRNSMEREFVAETNNIYFVKDSLTNIVCHKLGRHLPQFISEFSLGVLSHWDTQLRQRRLVRRIVEERKIQVVHEPIPVSPKVPSFMFNVGAPVIMGPMNGGMSFPPNYRPILEVSRHFISIMRATSALMNMLIPGKRRARLLLVANERTRKALPKTTFPERARVLVENGVDLTVFSRAHAPRKYSDVPRIAYAGAVIDWKRVDLLIKACKNISSKHDFILEIFGSGKALNKITKLSETLNGKVVFHGYVDQKTLARSLSDVDIFVLPSMRECGGAVVLEAMAVGIPVIATNWGGPTDYIDEACGILIDPLPEAEFIQKLSQSIEALIVDPSRRQMMGEAGAERVRSTYSWDRKIDEIMKIYEEAAMAR